MRKPARGLFWRLYATLLISLLLVAVAGAAVVHLLTPGPMHSIDMVQGRVIAELLPPRVAATETQSAVERLSRAVGGRVLLRAADGQVVAAAERGHRLDLASSPERLRPPHAQVIRVWRQSLADGRVLVVQAPVGLGRRGPHFLLMLLLSAAAVGLAAYPVVSRLTRRLERLKGSVEAWGDGRLDRRAAVEGSDEVAAVAEAFNAAADRVEALLAAHKAMLAHASHELRSPLARLRVASEIYAAEPRPELKAAIEREIGEIDGLVDEILLASRLDHSGDIGAPEPVDLLALAAEETARAGVELRPVAEAAPGFVVSGWPRLLRRMIRNLIDNAARHGGPPVEVEVSHDGEFVVLRVRDRGPGVPAAECERVFEPFHRPAGRAEAEGSWGLGLSLVRQIAGRHRGRASCRPRAGGGAVFVVELPVA